MRFCAKQICVLKGFYENRPCPGGHYIYKKYDDYDADIKFNSWQSRCETNSSHEVSWQVVKRDDKFFSKLRSLQKTRPLQEINGSGGSGGGGAEAQSL